VHQKCTNHALTNLLFDLCKFVWIIDPLVIRLSPHPITPAHLLTPEMLRTRIPTLFSFIVFTFELAFEFHEKFGGASSMTKINKVCLNYISLFPNNLFNKIMFPFHTLFWCWCIVVFKICLGFTKVFLSSKVWGNSEKKIWHFFFNKLNMEHIVDWPWLWEIQLVS